MGSFSRKICSGVLSILTSTLYLDYLELCLGLIMDTLSYIPFSISILFLGPLRSRNPLYIIFSSIWLLTQYTGTGLFGEKDILTNICTLKVLLWYFFRLEIEECSYNSSETSFLENLASPGKFDVLFKRNCLTNIVSWVYVFFLNLLGNSQEI